MSRLIDADEFSRVLIEHMIAPFEYNDYDKGLYDASLLLKNTPTIDLPHWIPCSERLPKYPYRVQIQLDNGWIITGYYSEEHWYTVPHCGGFLRNDEVEAWRELPEPYGGESE